MMRSPSSVYSSSSLAARSSSSSDRAAQRSSASVISRLRLFHPYVDSSVSTTARPTG